MWKKGCRQLKLDHAERRASQAYHELEVSCRRLESRELLHRIHIFAISSAGRVGEVPVAGQLGDRLSAAATNGLATHSAHFEYLITLIPADQSFSSPTNLSPNICPSASFPQLSSS